MGNTSSTRHPHDDSVDYGALSPQGVYSGPQDWNHNIVGQLIVDRRLAPFYRPLEDYDESWTDEQILNARKDLVPPSQSDAPSIPDPSSHSPPPSRQYLKHTKQSSSLKDFNRLSEASLYNGAVECPICFLYYPPNINRSRCCDHPICTECYVQIKRSDPSPTHLSSEPACCPYCVQDNFGVTYDPPSWRAGLGSENFSPQIRREALQPSDSKPDASRRKSFSADSSDVVTIDQIRPDWEAKLAAVRAAVQRRANRRIIMRQVGDRLIPVGITSGRIQIGQELSGNDNASPAQGEESNRGSRRRRGGNGQAVDLSQFLGMSGQDIEELMVMEAMRLSLAEHEEAQRKQDRDKKDGPEASGDGGEGAGSSSTPLSFVLTQRHGDSGAPSSGSSGLDTGQGQITASTTQTFPSVQAAIALGMAYPNSQASGARNRSRAPSPIPRANSSASHSGSVLGRLAFETANAIAGMDSTVDGSRQEPSEVASEHFPDNRTDKDDSSAVATTARDVEERSSGDGVEYAESPATSASVSLSYKALPSTPDSLANEPLLDKSANGSEATTSSQHEANTNDNGNELTA